MGAWKSVLVAKIFVDAKPSVTVHALKLFEPIEWNFACTSDELQKFGALFLVEGSNSTPEPLNLWRSRVIIVVLGVVLPIIDIDFRHTRNQQFQLAFVKDGNELSRDDIMEA